MHFVGTKLSGPTNNSTTKKAVRKVGLWWAVRRNDFYYRTVELRKPLLLRAISRLLLNMLLVTSVITYTNTQGERPAPQDEGIKSRRVNNTLHQTQEYVYWNRPPQLAPLKQQVASFSHRALRRLTCDGRLPWTISVSPSPACSANGSLHPPLWRTHHLGYNISNTPSLTFLKSLSRLSFLMYSCDRQSKKQEDLMLLSRAAAP